MKFYLILLFLFVFTTNSFSKIKYDNLKIKIGAERTSIYLPKLKGKRVVIVGNQTSIIGKSHLVDSLQKLGVNIVKVFGPEHDFRGNASNGTTVNDEVDRQTGVKII